MQVGAFGGGSAFPPRGEEAGVELVPAVGDGQFGIGEGEQGVGGEVPDGGAEGLQEVGVAVADLDQLGQGIGRVVGAEPLCWFG